MFFNSIFQPVDARPQGCKSITEEAWNTGRHTVYSISLGNLHMLSRMYVYVANLESLRI
jgi:hypothetical protein